MNATSLTIDPDEFMARMVAAGVPDMQLVPNSHAPGLITRTSASNLAGVAHPPRYASCLPVQTGITCPVITVMQICLPCVRVRVGASVSAWDLDLFSWACTSDQWS